jgi:hypothetical protein
VRGGSAVVVVEKKIVVVRMVFVFRVRSE